MTLNRWIAIGTAFAMLVFPVLSLADHHASDEEAAEHHGEEAAEHHGEEAAEHHGDNAGGKAAEHRSDRAAERSNAQWDDDNEGRPKKHHGDDDQNGDEDEKNKRDKKDKKSKKHKD
jgi:hypothetical protein